MSRIIPVRPGKPGFGGPGEIITPSPGGTPIVPPAPDVSVVQGIVYEMSMDIYDDDGCLVRRERWAPVIVNELNRIYHKRLRVDAQVGMLTLADDAEAQIMISYSDDGGQTFVNERTIGVGKLGEYQKLVETWRLGKSRNRIYKLAMTDAYPWAIADAYVEVVAGLS